MTDPRRDTGGLVIGIGGFILLAAFVFWMFTIGTWWSYVLVAGAAFFLLVFAFGISESAAKVERDEAGRRIKR